MNKDTPTKEYLKKLESMKLSDSSRARMEKSLLEYAQFHNVSEGVRVGSDARSIKQVPSSTSLFFFKRMYMPFVILLAVMVGGGTSFAAQGAVPGDFLYPVKTEVNESVRAAFAVGANAEADLQAELVAERIEEAQELEAEGRLEGEVAARLAADIRSHVVKAEEANQKSDAEVKTRTEARVLVALERFDALLDKDTALALNASSEDSEVATNAAFGTSIAAGKIDPQVFRASTQARVKNLIEVVEEHEAELSAEVFLSLNKKLDSANKLVIESQTQAETQSQQSLMKASELAGEVESKLTTLGTATIDVETGAIIDIDFTNVPALELDVRTSGEADDSGEGDNEVELDSETQSGVNIDPERIEVNTNGALRSGLQI